ncbi:MAG: DNA repair protein RecO [Nitrospirae bacterium]|nr:DNA repair protein RecO [Nitrospirota bacterium]
MSLYRRTEAIVLKNNPFQEADLIVTFLTLDYGIINAIAKSSRKIKSRFGSSLEPFTYSKVAFVGKEDVRLPRLTQSDIITSFHGLRENLSDLMDASEMAGITLMLLPEAEVNKKAFSLLMTSLHMLDKKHSTVPPVMLYKIRLLDIAGYSPSLKCVKCKKQVDGFYMEGAMLCNACVRAYNQISVLSPLSSGAIKLYESLRLWDIQKMSRIKPSVSMLLELKELIKTHIQYIASP